MFKHPGVPELDTKTTKKNKTRKEKTRKQRLFFALTERSYQCSEFVGGRFEGVTRSPTCYWETPIHSRVCFHGFLFLFVSLFVLLSVTNPVGRVENILTCKDEKDLYTFLLPMKFFPKSVFYCVLRTKRRRRRREPLHYSIPGLPTDTCLTHRTPCQC